MSEYKDLKKAIKALERRNNLYKSEQKDDDDVYKVALGKTFEICYECLKKYLGHYLENNSKVSKVPQSTWKVFELAQEHSIWKATPKHWEKYIKARNASTHNYSEQDLEKSIAVIDDFLQDAITIYENITGESWK